MPNVLGQCGDAVVTELAAGSDAGAFSLVFQPERQYILDVNTVEEELRHLRVDVIGSAAEFDYMDRGTLQYMLQIDVCVRRQFDNYDALPDGKIDPEKIDELVELLFEMSEYMADADQQRLTDMPTAVWQPSSKILTPYSQEHLRAHRIYLGILRLNYAVEATL